MVTEGDCHVELEGAPTTRLTAGDVVIFPHGHAHRMTSRARCCRPATGASPRHGCWRAGRAASRPTAAAGAITRLGVRLPRLRRAPRRDAARGAAAARARERAGIEAPGPGSRPPIRTPWPRPGHRARAAREFRPSSPRFFSSRSFASTCREQSAACTGWLAGVRDPIVGSALQALHRQPERSVDRRGACAHRGDLALRAGGALSAPGRVAPRSST